jgi:hypothetical protein
MRRSEDFCFHAKAEVFTSALLSPKIKGCDLSSGSAMCTSRDGGRLGDWLRRRHRDLFNVVRSRADLGEEGPAAGLPGCRQGTASRPQVQRRHIARLSPPPLVSGCRLRCGCGRNTEAAPAQGGVRERQRPGRKTGSDVRREDAAKVTRSGSEDQRRCDLDSPRVTVRLQHHPGRGGRLDCKPRFDDYFGEALGYGARRHRHVAEVRAAHPAEGKARLELRLQAR